MAEEKEATQAASLEKKATPEAKPPTAATDSTDAEKVTFPELNNTLFEVDEDLHSAKNFPQKLMGILSNPDHEPIVSWLPHGNGFMIHKKKEFAEEILPKYWKASKFTSFTRKLNRWGFSRAPRGPETGAYFHKLFRRDKPELCLQMTSNSGNNKQHLSPTHQTAHLYPSMMPSQNPWFPMMMPPPMSPQQQLQQQQAMWQMQMWQMQQMQMMHGGGYGNPMEMKQEEGNNVDSNQELADPRMEPAAMGQPSEVNVE